MTTPIPEGHATVSLTPLRWWQRGAIYQVYPWSFQDSNGDGIGDLPGILRRLGHLRWLGCESIWLSPIYPSPMVDFGYDVSNHKDVDPRFGMLEDFDALTAAARRLGLRVILDYIPNHTSDQHPWFVASRSSRDNPYRDWYLWRDPAPDGGPPNNWLSVFGGSAWQFDNRTGQYYLHTYLCEQPDVNWRNPDVQKAMLDVMRFWFERGVDGFRIDAISKMVKDAQFRDNPPNPDYRPEQGPYYQHLTTYSSDQPEVHDVIGMMRRVADEYGDTLLIGEAYLATAQLLAYYGQSGAGVHFPFNFQLIQTPWNAVAVRSLVDGYEGHLPRDVWPNWVLGNHDNHRIASRVGRSQARVAAMLLLTLRGTPILYYGDEIGMTDVPIPSELVQDPWERNVPGLGLGRDPERSPMQWDAGPSAGFTTGSPWLPIAGDYHRCNVAVQRQDPRSFLSLHRELIALRTARPALCRGRYVPVAQAAPDVMAYLREADGERILVALNFSSDRREIALGPEIGASQVLLSTFLDQEATPFNGKLQLRGDEGLIIALR